MLDAGQLWTAYAPQIRRFLASRVDAELVDDLLAETFLAVVEGLPRFEDRGWAPSAWIYTIARHNIIDAQRAARRRPVLPLFDHVIGIAGPEEAIARRVYHEWIRERITTCLPGQQGTVIWLRFVEDLELAEVAKRLGLSVGAVKALQTRGIANLRKAIAPDDMPSMMAAFADPEPAPLCSVEGCKEVARKRGGLCSRHYYRAYHARKRDPDARTTHHADSPWVRCRIEGCRGKGPLSDGLCKMHYMREWRTKQEQKER